MSEPFADEIDDIDWDEACRKADVIRKFLRRESSPTTAKCENSLGHRCSEYSAAT
jgi:hypothetical protein